MLDLLINIGAIIVFGIVMILVIVVIPEFISKLWIKFQHPDYKRRLNLAEKQYLERAQANLTDFSASPNLKKPFFWSSRNLWVLFAIFGIIVGIIWAGWKISIFFDTSQPAENVLYIYKEFYIFFFPLLFTGLIFTLSASYFMARNVEGYWEWMTLTQSTSRTEKPESILKRRLAQIEHDVRIRRLDIAQPFSKQLFLRSIAGRQAKYVDYTTYVLIGITGMFFYLDLHERNIFYIDRMTTNHYWIAKQETIPYSELTEIKVQCIKGEYLPILSWEFMRGETRLERLRLESRQISKYAETIDILDNEWRKYNIRFVPQTVTPLFKVEKSAYTQECLQTIAIKYDHAETKLLYKILHADELAPD